MGEAWKRVAKYTMLRLLKCGDLDSSDAKFIYEQITQAGGTPDEVAEFLALYREHR